MLNVRSFAFDSAQYHLIYGGIYQVNLEITLIVHSITILHTITYYSITCMVDY